MFLCLNFNVFLPKHVTTGFSFFVSGDAIRTKWDNIRDAFLRSLRTKSGQAAKKSYMYAEHLQFLLKAAKKGITTSNLTQDNSEDEKDEIENSSQVPSPAQSVSDLNHNLDTTTESSIRSTEPASNTSTQKKTNTNKKKRQLDPVEQEILSEIKKSKPSHNEHELMMLSFVPYIRDMNETELMDLHMNILMSIKSIKEKRSSNSRFHGSTSLPSTSPTTSSCSSCQSHEHDFSFVGHPAAGAYKQQPNMSQPPSDSNLNESTMVYCLQPLEIAPSSMVTNEVRKSSNIFQDFLDNQCGTEEDL